MKKIFKYLSILAVAGSLGMNTMNVKADGASTCEANGGVVHTNYYLFLSQNRLDTIEGYGDQKKVVQDNFKNVTNTIQAYQVLDEGQIKLTENLNNKTSWSYSEFWKRFYATSMDQVTSDTESYFYSGAWGTCYKQGSNKCVTYADKYLMAYLKENLANLDNSTIVTDGTIDAQPVVERRGYENGDLHFEVERTYTAGSLGNYDNTTKEGLLLKNNQDVDEVRVYAPAAYYIQYCATEEGNTEPFTVYYNANGGINAPASQTAQAGSCVKISDGKPTQTGMDFLGWSTDPKATEPDKNFDAGKDYCDGKTITLYAVWRPATGIDSHLIVFGAIAIGAAIVLIVAKQKNLFKQI